MDNAHTVTDPTDWLRTDLASFSPLENALRCQVCKDFFNTPMITSCSHTFCSLCIRRCLSAEGKCPACRAGEQASKLRRNWAIEEVVANFQVARPIALKLATQAADRENEEELPRRSNKRRRVETNGVSEESSSQRQTRSRTKRVHSPMQTEPLEVMDTDDETYGEQEPDDGLVGCPMCGTRMKEQSVFGHLDHCNGKKEDSGQRKSNPSNFPLRQEPAQPPSSKPQERIPELNYSLLKDTALRKKLQELGIANWGPRALLIRRHVEWVNLWNANCDSDRPRLKRDLLRDLESWERSQGGHSREAANGANPLMSKEFDSAAYMQTNKDDFSKLIQQAKLKAKAGPKAQEQGDNTNDEAESSEHGSANSANGNAADPEDRRRSHPYENNEEALSSIREKVKALNAGETVESQEHGMASSDPNSSNTVANGEAHAYEQPTQNEALMSQARFGLAHRHRSSHGNEEEPCNLPDHWSAEPTRKVPMFRVPEDPFVDVENGQAGS